MNGKKRILLKLTGTLLDPQHATHYASARKYDRVTRNTSVRHRYWRRQFFSRASAWQCAWIAAYCWSYRRHARNPNEWRNSQGSYGPSWYTARLLTAVACDTVAQPIQQMPLMMPVGMREILIFAAGTGNPFFTTDTNAIMRALQMQAHEVWKATNIDGIYTTDPHTDTNRYIHQAAHASRCNRSRSSASWIQRHLPSQKNIKYLFEFLHLFKTNALLEVAQSPNIGSIIETKDTHDSNYSCGKRYENVPKSNG